MRLPLHSIAAVLVACWCATPIGAQDFPSAVPQETAAPESPDIAPPLYAATVTGAATLTRDGTTTPLDPSAPVIDGDRIRTSAGRVELAGSPSASLFIDEHSVLDVVSSERLRAVGGRVRVVVKDVSQTPPSLDVPGGTVRSGDTGSYTVEIGQGARGDEVRLLVTGGTATFENDGGPLTVKAGESMTYRGGATPELAATNASPAAAGLQRWADDQLARQEGSTTASVEFLPEELAGYSTTLDRFGQWGQDPTYGDVWYPAVSVGWQPYSDGRWDRVGRYGWFWIGATSWAWPTHHYGRWGQREGRWFWRPDRRWAPSWVYWAVAPGFVGWCPIGPDNRPARGVVDAGNRVTYYRGGTAVGGDWQGWSLVPREAFDSRQAVTRARVDPRTIPYEVASSFVTQRVPPPGWGRPPGSVPRVTVPTGSGAPNTLRRGTSPANMTVPDGRPVPYGVPPYGNTTTSPYERAQRYMKPETKDDGRPVEGPGADATDAAVTRGGQPTRPLYVGVGGNQRAVGRGVPATPPAPDDRATGDPGPETAPPSRGDSGAGQGHGVPAPGRGPHRSAPPSTTAAPASGGLAAPTSTPQSAPPVSAPAPSSSSRPSAPSGSTPRTRTPSGRSGAGA